MASIITSSTYLPDDISDETHSFVSRTYAHVSGSSVYRKQIFRVSPLGSPSYCYEIPERVLAFMTPRVVADLRNYDALIEIQNNDRITSDSIWSIGDNTRKIFCLADTVFQWIGAKRRPIAPTRPSFDDMGLKTALLWASRSSDEKLKVGVSILSDTSHTLVSVGYNGRHPGSKTEARESMEIGGSAFIHAEINALLRARWEIGETHTLYTTTEPCHNCALAILAARYVKRVVFSKPYAGDGKQKRGSVVLQEAGLTVSLLLPLT
jgi:dCMP deaminase